MSMGTDGAVFCQSSDPETVRVQADATARDGTYRVVVQATATPQTVEVADVKALAGKQLQVNFLDGVSLAPVEIVGVDALLPVCETINADPNNIDRRNGNTKRVYATCSAEKLVITALVPGKPGSFTASSGTSGNMTERISAGVSGGADAVVAVNDIYVSARGDQVEAAVPGAELTVLRPGSAIVTIGSGTPTANPDARKAFVVTSIWFVLLGVLALLYGNFWHWSWLDAPPDVAHPGVSRVVVPPDLGPVPTGALWFGAVGAVLASWAGIFRHNADWQNSYNYWHWARPAVGAILGGISVLMLTVLLNATNSGTTNPGTPAGTHSRTLFFVLAFIVGYREATFRSLIGKITDLVLGPGPTPNPAATSGTASPQPPHAASATATQVTIEDPPS